MSRLIEYFEYFQLYNQPQVLRSDCNSLTVVNIGTATAIIDGLQLIPGAQYITQGNNDEINRTQYNLRFQGVGTNEVLVIRKIYK